jgi:cell division protein FtsW
MFSASYAYAFRMHGDSYFYAMRQLVFIIIGLAAMGILSLVDYRILLNKHIVKIGATVSIGLMLLVRVIGVTQYGAERWFEVFGITVQPSEILKLAVIIVFAYLLHTRYSRLKELRYGFLPLLGFLVISCGLTLLQPHLSGTIIIFLVGLIMMFVGDCKVKHIVVMIVVFLLLASIGLGLLGAMGYDYFSDRILSWQNPEADIQDKTFQTYQSLVTIGSGGFFGLGLGNSRQKYAYLPASHNDFIFSIICEELGFVGAILVILLFLLFVFRGFYIAGRARDKFGMLLAVGITSQLGVQALLNIGVVTNSVPNTGISLPFFSYGGSALIMQLASIGVLLNISRKAAIE